MVEVTKRSWTARTFKREVAVCLLIFWALVSLILTVKMVFYPGDAAMIAAIGTAYAPIHSSITTLVMTFAGLAFGLDAMAKQLGVGGPKQ